MEFRMGTGVFHKMLWNFHLAQVSCVSDRRKSQKHFFFNCKDKYFQDLPHFLSVMSEMEMNWVCTMEDTQRMVVKAETSETEGLMTSKGQTLNMKLKATVFLQVFAKLSMTVRENISPFHRKGLSFPGDLAEARGS